MKKYFDTVLNQTGDPIQNVSVTVLQYPSNALANIFSDNGLTQTTNPIVTDALGGFQFYTGNGRYNITYTGNGVAKATSIDVLIEDPADAQSYIINGGSINATPIGSIIPSSAAFTTLTASSLVLGSYNGPVGTVTPNVGTFTTLSTADLNVTNIANATVTIAVTAQNALTLLGSSWLSPGSIGATTPNSGSFTTLASSGATSLGAITATSLNNTPIGATTPSTGAFTTLAVSSGINNIPIGSTTASTGIFTTLVSTSGINSTNIGAATAGTGRFTTVSATTGIDSSIIGATTPAAGTFTTGTITTAIIASSLSLNSSAILQGDFSNATLTSRSYIKSSTLNGTSALGVIPNGLGTSSLLQLYGNVTPTNASITTLGITATESQIFATKAGSGTFLPLNVYTSDVSRMLFDITGNIGIGKVPAARSQAGNLEILGSLSTNTPIAKTVAFTVGDQESSYVITGAATLAATLPNAVTFPGRWIYMLNLAAFTVTSPTSNVVGRTGGAAGTTILAAAAGSWCWLQSNGTTWQVMAGA